MVQEAVSLIKQHPGERRSVEKDQHPPKLCTCIQTREEIPKNDIGTRVECCVVQNVVPGNERVVFDVQVPRTEPEHGLRETSVLTML